VLFRSIKSVGISSTGQYQTITDNIKFMWNSSDFGNTWQENNNILKIVPRLYAHNHVSISSSGKYQYITSQNDEEYGICKSEDYGKTWKFKKFIEYPSSLAISSSGQYLTIIVIYLDFYSPNLSCYISNDYGKNLKKILISDVQLFYSYENYSIAMSSSGQYQAIGTNYGIWVSNDFGKIWNHHITNGFENNMWKSISMSSSGKYLTAISNELQDDYTTIISSIWCSIDFGSSWFLKLGPSNTNWIASTMSSTGEYQTVTVYGGGIYTSNILLNNQLIKGTENENSFFIENINRTEKGYGYLIVKQLTLKI
jgi:hypothetical protein